MPPAPSGIVLIDGHCLLCQAWVRFLLPRDPHGRLQFAALQSEAAVRVLEDVGVDPGTIPLSRQAPPSTGPGSVLFLRAGALHDRSSAALHILGSLGLPWSLLAAFLVVPRPLRDAVYDFVARRRYRWFGRSEACMVPPADYDQRFLDADELPTSGPRA